MYVRVDVKPKRPWWKFWEPSYYGEVRWTCKWCGKKLTPKFEEEA